jgi:hypothetical protein
MRSTGRHTLKRFKEVIGSSPEGSTQTDLEEDRVSEFAENHVDSMPICSAGPFVC